MGGGGGGIQFLTRVTLIYPIPPPNPSCCSKNREIGLNAKKSKNRNQSNTKKTLPWASAARKRRKVKDDFAHDMSSSETKIKNDNTKEYKVVI